MHSLRAVRSLLMVCGVISMRGRPDREASLISERAATALATTWGFHTQKKKGNQN